jgi:hypothetical protein
MGNQGPFNILHMQTKRTTGFTLIEVMIIAPIVILFIGAFIALVVNLTGESLRLREKNAAAFNVQEALNDIEANVTLATSFHAETPTLVYPQGRNSTTNRFTNVRAGEPDTLIMKAAATTKNPIDPTRSLIYTGSGACNARNVVYQYYTIYFISDESLYKRTILPQQAACAIPWQRGSCEESFVAANPTVCKKSDEKLLENVSTMDIQYFSDASSSDAIPDSEATDANSISINIGLSKSVAGQALSYTGTSRVTSLNAQASDTVTDAPPEPQVTWTSSSTTPYTTTFQWTSIGNATGYNVRYRIDGGAWVNGPQNTTATSYNVVTTHRKQTVEAEVTALTSAGNYVYGTASRTIPRWQDCTLLNGWTNYSAAYASAGFTRTSAGVVGLRGLIKDGPIDSSANICTLPVGFRPAQHLIFQVGGYDTGASGAARVDVYSDGTVRVSQGQTNWVSLSGITFLAAGAGTTVPWTNGTWTNSWVNYSAAGNTWGDLKYAKDTLGRVHVEGLGRPGTQTAGTVITNSLTASGFPPSHFMHITSRASNDSAISFAASGAISVRGVPTSTSYQSLSFAYYPAATSVAWTTLPLANGWVNYNSTTYSPAQCFKGSDDLVMVRGLIKSGTAGGMGSLPAACGAHTDGQLLFPAWMAANSVARVDLTAAGTLTASVYSATWTSLDNIRFIAD